VEGLALGCVAVAWGAVIGQVPFLSGAPIYHAVVDHSPCWQLALTLRLVEDVAACQMLGRELERARWETEQLPSALSLQHLQPAGQAKT
jgi:hypothetical protein